MLNFRPSGALAMIGMVLGVPAVSALAQVTPQAAAQGAELKQDDVSVKQRQALLTYANIAFATYSDALSEMRKFEKSMQDFIAAPSASKLTEVRNAWLAARVPYLQSETFRFSNGPVDAIEPRLNAWPIDENYIDYTEGSPQSGVINNPAAYPEITAEVILGLNEKEGEKNISLGYHAIEFLLWGQDLFATGPGDRSFEDYVIETTPTAGRRQTYLKLCTELLVADLSSLVREWSPDVSGNYREMLLGRAALHKALGDIFHGLGVFSGVELAGERLTVSYKTKDQEDEHSCFSDNTHNDVRYDVAGTCNVYFGRYVRTDGSVVSGPSLHDLIAATDPHLADVLAQRMRSSLKASESIPAPFDQAVLGPDTKPGRKTILETIKALQMQAAALAEATRLILTGEANSANLR